MEPESDHAVSQSPGSPPPDRGPLVRTQRRPPQFSLLSLLVVTAGFAVSFSLLLAVPGLIRLLSTGVLLVALPAVLTVALVYGRGYTRTFCIGALFPAAIGMLLVASDLPRMLHVFGGVYSPPIWRNPDEIGFLPAVLVGVHLAISFLFGLMAVGVRWLIERGAKQEEP